MLVTLFRDKGRWIVSEQEVILTREGLKQLEDELENLRSEHDDVEIVAINSTSNPEGTAHLFQYDSTHGTYRGEVSYTEDSLVVDGKKIRAV